MTLGALAGRRRRRGLAAGRDRPALGQTLLLALAGALLTTLAADPDGLAVGPRARAGCSARWRPATTIVGSLPGVVVALALVTITVRVALPLYQTRVHRRCSPMR